MSEHTIFCDKVGIKKVHPTDLEANHQTEQSTTSTKSKRTIFCGKVGIKKVQPTGPEPVDRGFYQNVLNAYKGKTRHYLFIVTIIHILQLLQIIFGATATAISASKVPTIAVTVLTAIVTVVAGILAFIRGHLDRTHHVQNGLREVRDYIRFKEMEYRESAPGDATVEVAIVKEAKDAKAEVEKAMADVKKLYYNAIDGNKGDKTKSPGAWLRRLLAERGGRLLLSKWETHYFLIRNIF